MKPKAPAFKRALDPNARPLRVKFGGTTKPPAPMGVYNTLGKRTKFDLPRRSSRRVKAYRGYHANAAVAKPTRPDTTVLHHALHGNAFNPDTGQIAEYEELSKCSDGPKWIAGNEEEVFRLAQGHGYKIQGTNTIKFIPVSAIPKGRKSTYLRVVCAYRPEKPNPFRVRWTVGGDRIDYPGDVSTKTADLVTAKLLFNSVISTENGRFMGGDIKNFYLGTPMSRYEYMRIPVSMLSQRIIKHYELEPLIYKGAVYVEIRKGMYGLPQAGKIANVRLQNFLEPHGY